MKTKRRPNTQNKLSRNGLNISRDSSIEFKSKKSLFRSTIADFKKNMLINDENLNEKSTRKLNKLPSRQNQFNLLNNYDDNKEIEIENEIINKSKSRNKINISKELDRSLNNKNLIDKSQKSNSNMKSKSKVALKNDVSHLKQNLMYENNNINYNKQELSNYKSNINNLNYKSFNLKDLEKYSLQNSNFDSKINHDKENPNYEINRNKSLLKNNKSKSEISSNKVSKSVLPKQKSKIDIESDNQSNSQLYKSNTSLNYASKNLLSNQKSKSEISTIKDLKIDKNSLNRISMTSHLNKRIINNNFIDDEYHLIQKNQNINGNTYQKIMTQIYLKRKVPNIDIVKIIIQFMDFIEYLAAGDGFSIILNNNKIAQYFGSGRKYGSKSCYNINNISPFPKTLIRKIIAGQSHSLFITDNDQIFGIGDNRNDQLTFSDEVQGQVMDAACTSGVSIVVTKSGHAITFGRIKITECFKTKEVQGRVRRVSGGFNHVIQLLTDKSVRVQGEDNLGQCKVPKAAQGRVAAVSAGHAHSVQLTEDGAVQAAGCNAQKQCAVPEWAQGRVAAVAAGYENSLLLLRDNCVAELGRMWFAECTVASAAAEASGRVLAMRTSRIHTMLLMDNGLIRCVGRNMYGECSVPKQYLQTQR